MRFVGNDPCVVPLFWFLRGKIFSLAPDRIGSYFRAEWLPLTFVTISGVLYNVGLLASPWFEGRLAQCLVDILGGNGTAGAMAALVVAYLAVTLAVQGARFVKRFYVRRFANNINRRMKDILYANLVRKSRAAPEKEGAGELMTKAISDVDDCAEGMRKFTTEVFDTGVALLCYAVMPVVYDWRLALMSLLFTPISYFCAAGMKKVIQRAGAAYKKAAGAMRAATPDRAENAVTYRVYGCEETREARYEAVLDRYEKSAVRANVWQSALSPLYPAVSCIGVLFILWFGGKNVLGTGRRAWDIAAFTTFLSCFTKLTTKSSKVAKLFNSVQKAEASWKRIKPMMQSPEPLEELKVPAPQDVTPEKVSFSYGDAPIFSDLSLAAHVGDVIGIMGPVACGKSTLGRVFLCEAPYGGSVRFGARELSSLSPRALAATVGYLGHAPELFADSLRRNVLCGSAGDPMPSLCAVALDGEALAMENGVDTVIGSGGTRLSGGQAQRLALARTLEHPRPLLILDDPFSALDRGTEDKVFANLKEYARDKVVFLISHRLYHFPELSRIVFMEDGDTTVGTHAELMASVPSYRTLYESQTGGAQHEARENE
ncbi:MAG TPA: ABC transporter ATP-binding protein [Clostridiales bacterium]|nr:ABC transporter ATP-binding protein [Clostridiales bacterium]